MKCGVCGGGVRLFTGLLHGRPITDWKHTDAPPGTVPHRPVLGRPVDEATLVRLRAMKEEARRKKQVVTETKEIGAPLIFPRIAADHELAPAAKSLMVLLSEYDWVLVNSPVFYQTAESLEACIIRASRADVSVVGCWERPSREKSWAYRDGFVVCHGLVRQVGSEQLKASIRQRDERCPDCGSSSAAHIEGDCP